MRQRGIAGMVLMFAVSLVSMTTTVAPASAECKTIRLEEEGHWKDLNCNLTGLYKSNRLVAGAGGTTNGNWQCRKLEAGAEATREGGWPTESCSAPRGINSNYWVWTLIPRAWAEILSSKEQKEWTGALTEPVFEAVNKEKVKCLKGSITGTLEAGKHSGASNISFEGCTGALGAKCTGLGDTTGVILASAAWKSAIDIAMPDGAAVVFEYEPFHFSCSIVLLLVKGTVLCGITEPKSLKATHEFKCEGKEGKVGEAEKVYFNSGGERVVIAPLLWTVNGGSAEELAQTSKGTMTFKEAVEIMDS